MMLHAMRSIRRRGSAAWRIATAIALVAQCWVTVAAFTESRGLGASAHVEAAGISKHFAHNDATCPACSVLALHALVPSAPPAPLAPILRAAGDPLPSPAAPATAPQGINLSRAPPAEL